MQSITQSKATAHNGLLVKYQRGILHSAPVKNSQSSLVILSPGFLQCERPTITKHRNAENPVTQAPGPAFSESCEKKMTLVVRPQMIHVKICGLLRPAIIARI